MSKLWIVLLALTLACAAFGGAGCGNVYLKGEAMTAAQQSALDAYQAVQRHDAATNRPAGEPSWTGDYLAENYKQWRYFVRAAKKDEGWGPKIGGE